MTIHIEHRLDLFLEEELQQIIDYGDALSLSDGEVYRSGKEYYEGKGNRVDHSVRKAKIAWIHPVKIHGGSLIELYLCLKVVYLSVPFNQPNIQFTIARVLIMIGIETSVRVIR